MMPYFFMALRMIWTSEGKLDTLKALFSRKRAPMGGTLVDVLLEA